jgi:signal transduction histidine kinase
MMSHTLTEVDSDHQSFVRGVETKVEISGLSTKKVRVAKAVNKSSSNGRSTRAAKGSAATIFDTENDTGVLTSNMDDVELLQAENAELKARLKAQTTELSDARAEALHAMELKAQFMANVSHELRTPLSGVLGMAELLKEMPLTSDQEELVSYIYVSAAGLVDVVNSLLDFSRLQSGKLRIEKSKFSVQKLLQSIKESFAEVAGRKGLHLEFSIGKDVPESLSGDELRIRQVLSGLTNNAIKFSERGTIHIQAQLVKKFDDMAVVRFVVKDSGIGIPVSEQERIFMPFVQVDGSSTRRYGGVGLGLPICKLLVQLMSGSMSLTSSAGKGSSFSFSLPLEVNS